MHASPALRLFPPGVVSLLLIPGGVFASRYFHNGRIGVIELPLPFLALKAHCFRSSLKKVRVKEFRLSTISLLNLNQ